MDVKIFSVLLAFALSHFGTCDDMIYRDDKIPDHVKTYVTSFITDLTNKYERRIQTLELKVEKLQQKSGTQGNTMQRLRIENEMLQNFILRLEKQVKFNVSNMTAAAGMKAGDIKPHIKGLKSRARSTALESRVAFYAFKSLPTSHLGKGQGIVFDEVKTNIGGAYNVHDGTFIAPVTGVYVFGVTLGHYNTFVQSDNGDGNLVVNGVIVAGLFMSNDQSSQMVVLSLKVGDNVAVLNRDADEGIDGKAYSSFSGFLLYET